MPTEPTDWRKILSQMPVRSLRAILTDLAQMGRQNAAGPLPKVSIYLTGGQVLTGSIVAFEAGHMQSMVVIHSEERADSSQTRHQVYYVDLVHIAAIGIDDAGRSEAGWRVVTGGKVAEPAPAEPGPMSRLDFQRYLVESSAALATILHSGFTIDVEPSLLEGTEDFADFQLQVANLSQALTAVNREAWGRQALMAKVQRVLLQQTAQFTLRLEEHTLVAGLHPQSGPSADQLKSTLEALL